MTYDADEPAAATGSEAAPHPPLRPPQQGRSRQTLERLGEAVTELLGEKRFDDITVVDVVQRAGVSTGSFYGRFASKDALLVWLEDHYFADSRRTMEVSLDPARWRGVPLAGVVEGIVRLYLDFLEKHRHLLEPIVLANRRDPGGALARRSRELNGESYRRVVRLLAERRDEIASDDPEAAASWALATLYALSHELVLFGEAGLQSVPALDDREALVSRLARTLLAYLKWTDAEPPTPDRTSAVEAT